MTAIRVFLSRLVTRLRRRERDVAPEIEAHLELLTAQYMRDGMSEREAIQAARRALGNITHITESYRQQTGLAFADALARDVRFASRLFQRNPWFSATAVMTMAIGIGSTTAVFTVVDQFLFRPPPYLHGDRLVQVIGLDRPNGGRVKNLNARRLAGRRAS